MFKDFTNLYELSKTLRFELRPTGKIIDSIDLKTGEIKKITMTEKMLLENGVFDNDKLIQEKYKKTKPYFDRLHREFVEESLSDILLRELDDYEIILSDWKKDKKNKDKQKRLQIKEAELRKQVVNFFNEKAREWIQRYSNLRFKGEGVELFFEEGVFALLKEKYGKEDDANIKNEKFNKVVSIFDSWRGFTGYFKKFQETRKNFYKDDGTSTALATRIIDQNLRRFTDNLQDFKRVNKKIDFLEIENNFGKKMRDVFSFNFYNKCLLQNDIDFYNQIIGGKTLGNGKKLRGINELINEYRQKNKGEKLSFLKVLDKQILSEREKFANEIENDRQLLKLLRIFFSESEKRIFIVRSLFEDFNKNNEKYNLEEIYISKEAFNTISRRWTNEGEKFEKLLYESMKPYKLAGLNYNKKENSYKFPDFIAVIYLKDVLGKMSSDNKFWKDKYYKTVENQDGFLSEKENIWKQFLDIFINEFEGLFEKTIVIGTSEEKKTGYDVFKNNFKELIDKSEFFVNQDSKIVIKNFSDSVLSIYQMAKYFAVEKKRAWVASYELDDFYTNPENGYLLFYDDAFEEIIQVYNKLRNYLTKKPFSEEKLKLNFENPTLANGWDKNKESDNASVILRKSGRYYLGVMKKGNNQIFSDRNKDLFSRNLDDNKYEKIVYKYLPDAAKMIPKCSTQLKDVRKYFLNSNKSFEINNKSFISPLIISKRIYDLNNTRYSKVNINKETNDEKKGVKKFQKEYLNLSKNNLEYRSALNDWIGFCKDFLSKYESTKDFNLNFFRSNEDYNSLDEFYSDIEKISYSILFQDVSGEYIEDKNNKGELYLFEIHNQDWNLKDGKKKVNVKNLHTLYFENIFSRENITNNFPIKLNGQSELFFRPKTEVKKLEEKKDKNGNVVIDHKRYSQDKIFFHCPITLNRAKGKAFNFNSRVNNFLANNKDINIIGVDRGEKHLAYYSVIKQNGDIIESGSLNFVNGINYSNKLEIRARDRERAKKDWQGIEDIKNLKKGYISQVVRKIADLAINYNAIIVFEDLNMRFKQIRGGIEKSIYQQLEKALIDKISYLVKKKEVDVSKAGHLLKAYQLAAPFETFQKMGKQTGIIFYTQASYTSKIDPLTGWRPNLYLKNTNVVNNKKNIENFDKILFNKEEGRFEFSYDIVKFSPNQKEYPKKTKWVICSCVERWRWNRKLANNKGDYEHYEDVTNNFKELFVSKGIDFNRGDIIDQIKSLAEKGNERFFSTFIFYFNLLCQIRNTDGQLDKKIKKLQKEKRFSEISDEDRNNVDFILSPIEPFFDSRKKYGNNFPENGDDNGAYNIARKGIMILDKISQFHKENKNCDKMNWGELYVSHIDWDNFIQR